MEDKNTIDSSNIEPTKSFSRLRLRNIFVGDGLVWFIVGYLIVFSLLLIYSSTISITLKDHGEDILYFLRRRFRDIIVASIALIIAIKIRLPFIYKYMELFFGASILLLIITLIFGEEVNGATRTFHSIQPSDFAKIAMILMLAKIMTKYKDVIPYVTFIPLRTLRNKFKMKSGGLSKEEMYELDRLNLREMYVWRNYSWKFLLPIILTFAFIFSANLSTGLMVIIIGFAVLIMGGIRFFDIAALSSIIGGLIYSSISILANFEYFGRVKTWKMRIDTFFSTEDSFQSMQAKRTIAQGLIPQGPGGSVQRANLPRSESDFMFAFIVEEYGVIGAVFIMLSFIWLFSRARRIAMSLDDNFEVLICVGLSFFITFQAAIHCLVNVGLMPVTGLVLPFLSAGGSALVSMGVAIGLILNISRKRIKR